MNESKMKIIHSLRFKQIAAAGFYLLILLGSSVPGQNIPKIFKFTPDKLIHVLEYTVLGWLLIRWLRHQFPHPAMVYGAMAAGVCCAVLDESYQKLIPNRSSDVWDASIDAVGVALGILIFTLFNRKMNL